jgi:hypothetical protein
VTVRDIRIAAAWLRQQAEAQEAREAWVEHQRQRHARGRWTNGQYARVRGRAGRQDSQFSTDKGAVGQGPRSAPL